MSETPNKEHTKVEQDKPSPSEAELKFLSPPRSRGRLKVYLGMSAGVGKTFAMLNDAQLERQQGKDVISGYIEPHARPETMAMALKVPQLPLRAVEYKGLTLREFDLDGALARKPAVILVDELAHTNAFGSRHAKRWQDVEELLSQGIDVRTTLNIQHIESLKDVVIQITGVEALETVPDSFLTKADDYELVDIPPAELLSRLESGKIYAKDKIGAALTNFFRTENLVALREIALRHTANAVDVQLRNLRSTERDNKFKGNTPRVMVCIAASKFAPRLVRAAARLANNLKAPLVVANVETPRTLGVNETDQKYLQKAIGLAERMGGEVIRTAGNDIVKEVLKVARQQHASILVIGKPNRSRLVTFLFGSVVDDLIRRSNDIDVHVVYGKKEEASSVPVVAATSKISIRSSLLSIFSIFITSIFAFSLAPYFDPTNLAMLFILPVIWAAFRLGRYEANLAAVLGVLVFDFFFVPPRGSFSVSDIQYLVTFFVMLALSTVISTLAQRAREQAEASAERERRTSLLLGLSKRLSDTHSKEEVASIVRIFLSDLLSVEVVLFWPNIEGTLVALNRTMIAIEEDPQEIGVAQWVSSRKSNAGKGTDTLPASKGLYIALDTEKDYSPVLALYRNSEPFELNEIELVEAFAHLVAGALRRSELQLEASASELKSEREELRNILLSSVSHDLRTPLTAISGIAGAIEAETDLSPNVRQLVNTLGEQASHLTSIVSNVLELTKLESGKIILRRDWNSIEEIVGVTLRRTQQVLATRKVTLQLPEDLALVFIDGLLMEQVFVNIIENFARHTPLESTLLITGTSTIDTITLHFSDDGPGLPPDTDIFTKLVKGSHSQGIGLGLALCKAIIEAHGGNISASNINPHGAEFSISLPALETPPEIENEP